jgi:HEAT repeat protein
MSQPLATLIEQLADLNTRDAARAQLVAAGESSIGPLLAAFHGSGERVQRRIIVQVLSEFHDSRVEDLLGTLLTDMDEDIRAAAAAGLRKLESANALQASLTTINDAPDPLHYDVTPSVLALANLGLPVLESVLPLLDSPDPRTRQHAQKVLELATSNEIVASVKPRALADTARQQWVDLWSRNGPYRWDAAENERREAIQRWESWLHNRER